MKRERFHRKQKIGSSDAFGLIFTLKFTNVFPYGLTAP
jgi:hypothetical protein